MIIYEPKINIKKTKLGLSQFLKISKSDVILAVKEVFLHLNFCNKSEITFVFCDDEFIQKYNLEYRKKNKPTNVLSFPSDDFVRKGGYLGDVLISFETIAREAREQERGVKNHATHMIVHSVLHLLGYDHEKLDEQEEMEGLEIDILAKLGINNPYII